MPEIIQPHDPAAERAVIGGALLSPALTADLLRMVTPEDFCQPNHAHIWAAIEARHNRGDQIDATVIAGDLPATVTDARNLLADCMAEHASAAAAVTHAVRVAELATTRKIETLTNTVLSRIRDGIKDPGLLLDALEVGMSKIDLPNDPRPPEGLWVAADLLAADWPEPPWVVPGFLREAWRCIFVAAEGAGKSTLCRQIVTAVSAGRHPFTDEPTTPVPGLIVDAENPESVVRDGLKMLRPSADEADLMLWCRPGGIDIRQRRDRDHLHRVFEIQRPKIAAVGPLYKMYRTQPGEPDEAAAIAAQQILDEVRVAHGCALVIETHAPKGSSMHRPLEPFGSSAWMRWPELGWQLKRCDANGNPDTDGDSLSIGRFRGDRVHTEVPSFFYRGKHGGLPWRGFWPRGVPKGWAA